MRESQYAPGPHAGSASGKKSVTPPLALVDTFTNAPSSSEPNEAVLSTTGRKGKPDGVTDGVGATDRDPDSEAELDGVADAD